MLKIKLINTALLGLVLSVSCLVTNANATLIQVSTLISDKECKNKGIFTGGNGFSTCQISVQSTSEEYLHDTIVKYSGGLELDEINKDYKDTKLVDSFKFTSSGKNKTGTWTYNKQDFTSPDIKFWLAKAGNDGFNLFWQIDVDDIATSPCIDGKSNSNSSYECMSLAESVTTGTWETPSNKNLSHITYFGGLCEEDETGTGCAQPVSSAASYAVPEPSSIALLSLALFGIIVRRKNITS